MEEYMSVPEAAKLWNCDESFVRRYLRERRIKGAKKFGRDWMIPRDTAKPRDGRRTPRELTSIDLFSGPGGLATGFRWAGIHPLIAVEWIRSTSQTYSRSHDADILDLDENSGLVSSNDLSAYIDEQLEDSECSSSFKTAFFPSKKTLLLRGDVSKVSNQLIKEILHRRFNVDTVDIVSGGAPCESFSMAGDRKEVDYRNDLFRNILRVAQAVNARAFLFENVKGLFSKKHEGKAGEMYRIVCDSFEETSEDGVGFRLVSKDKDTVLLKAANYGVPQFRERLFLVGLNQDDPELRFEYPEPTNGPNCTTPYVTVGDAITDLPSLSPGEIGIDKPSNRIKYKPESDRAMSTAQEGFLSYMKGELSDPPKSRIDAEVSPDTDKAPGHTMKMRKRLENIKQGENMKAAYNRLLKEGKEELVAECFPHKIYAARNRRLRLNEPSFTVTSHCLDEMVHPRQNRGLTPREAARLQSFPDWYYFYGEHTQFHGDPEEDQYEQIGDAIPPLLAMALGKSFVEALGYQRD